MNWLSAQTTVVDAAIATGEFAVNWMLQSTLLIAVGLTTGWLLRRRGAAVQSAVFRTTLAAVLVCPLATWVMSRAGVSGWSVELPAGWSYKEVEVQAAEVESTVRESAGEAVEVAPVAAVGQPIETVWMASGEKVDRERMIGPAAFDAAIPAADELTPIPEAEKSAAGTSIEPGVEIPVDVAAATESVLSIHRVGMLAAAAMSIWLLVALGLIVRLATAWWWLTRLRRSAAPADAPTQRVCLEVASALNVSAPEVLRSPYLPSPCLAGIRRPAVLLPDVNETLMIRDVLIHELAHVRRRDCHWNLLRQIATAVFFFQPLLWRLARRLEATAEDVCDDFVVQYGADRTMYAHRLVDIAELSSTPAATFGVGIVSLRSMLARRVARIMDTSRTLSTRVGNLLLVVVLCGGLLGTMLVGLVGVGPQPSQAEAKGLAADAGGEETDNVVADAAASIPTTTAGLEEPASNQERAESTTTLLADASGIAGESGSALRYAGRVVGPDGEAVPDAEIHLVGVRGNDSDDPVTESLGRTDDAGRFDFDFEIDDAARLDSAVLVASAVRFGPDWVSAANVDGEITLTLARDDLPIRGQILDLEGEPVAGAEIRASAIRATADGDLNEYLRVVKAGHGSNYRFDKYLFNPPSTGPVMTDEQGRFELTGVGGSRRVDLELVASEVERVSLRVLTLDTERIAPQKNDGRAFDDSVYGAAFTHLSRPSRIIRGRVRVRESREPVANVTVTVFGTRAHAKTDANGRFELIGAPKGSDYHLVAWPSDSVHLAGSRVVTDTSGLAPLEVDVLIPRGTVVRGRITDAKTGEPVAARLSYFPLYPNEHIVEGDGYSAVRATGGWSSAETDGQGNYAIPVFAGPGFVSVLARNKQRYETAAVDAIEFFKGKVPYGDSMASEAKNRNTLFTAVGVGAMAAMPQTNFNAVELLLIDPRGQDLERDVTLVPADVVRGFVVDGDGQSIENVRAHGLSPTSMQDHELLAEGEFRVTGLRSGQERHVIFRHDRRELVAAIDVTVEVEQPLHVKLEPWGEVRGRFVDANGDALANQLLLSLPDDAEKEAPGHLPRPQTTDDEGRFHVDGLVPGRCYVLRTLEEFDPQVRVVVQPGEILELGEIRPGQSLDPDNIRQTEEPGLDSDDQRTPSRATPNANEPEDSVNRAREQRVTVTGTAFEANGRAVEGAEIYFAPRSDVTPHDLRKRATTDVAGRFQFTIDRGDLDRVDPRFQSPANRPYMVARRDGFGPAFARIASADDAADVELRLVPDDVPVAGRIVDLEGNPVAGVTLLVRRLSGRSTGSLDDWVRSLVDYGELWNGSGIWLDENIRQELSGLPSAVKTDTQGRFRIRGAGRERVVELRLEGPNIETQLISVMTRAGEPLFIPHDKRAPRVGRYICYGGPEFDHIAAPSQPVEGTIRDAASGEPIAEVTIYCHRRAGTTISGHYPPETVSDARGRFRLTGLPVGPDNKIAIVPPADSPYVRQMIEVATNQGEGVAAGLATKTVDVDLQAGLVIRGRVTDDSTGEPVADARVEYFALSSGELNLEKFPGFRDADDVKTTTDADGKYQITGLPGRGLIAVRASTDEFTAGHQIDVRDTDYEVNPQIHKTLYRAFPSICIGEDHHALAVVETGADAGEANRDVALVRGTTVQVSVVDENGKPLTGAEVNRKGMYAAEFYGGVAELDADRFTVYGLVEEKSRRVFIRHQAGRLAGGFIVTTDDAPRMEVRLAAAGKIVGRLVDHDGQSVAHRELSGKLAPGQDGFYGDYFRTSTDEDGRFELDGLIPRLKYQIRGLARRGDGYLLLPREAFAPPTLVLEAGETLDLGEILAGN